ncbi:unnamed protein product [Mytilus coruscus]|uniref:Uncharacterized protein n=1 Tax=Mytilus coruscus TaxID=42192 RepID=A0A6J8B2Z0_MYTCO|nr:unnamed protein product [Mytilus coruscus]
MWWITIRHYFSSSQNMKDQTSPFFLTKDNSLKCDGSFSPLHEIIMNDRNTQSMYYNYEFLNKYLKDYSGKMLDKCFDKDGYNLLHRAVMGGNLLGTRFLVKTRMTISHLSRHAQSALNISIIKVPFLENRVVPLRYSNYSQFQVLQFISENRTEELIVDFSRTLKYDETAEFLLENLYTSRGPRRGEIETVLCRPNGRHLSLVHLAAAKGFISFLKKCTLFFGSDILNCNDFNKITPYYLAKIYKQESVIKWMVSIRIPRTKPNLEIESLLIYFMLFSNKRQNLFDWTCRLQYSFKHYGLIQTQVSKCRRAVRDQDNFLLYKNVFRDIYIRVTYLVLNSMENFQIESSLGICDFDVTMHICSALVDMNN